MRGGVVLAAVALLLTACAGPDDGPPPEAQLAGAEGDVGAHGDGPAALAAASPDTSWYESAADVEELFVSGFGIVVATGMAPSEALTALAPDAALPESPATEVAAWQWASMAAGDDVSSVVAGQVGDGVLLVDRWGSAILAEGVLESLSAKGSAILVMATVNLDWMVQYAVGGQVVRTLDPWGYDSQPGDDPPLPEEAGLGFGEPGTDLGQAALDLVERLTGVHVTLDDLLTTEGLTGVGVILRSGAFLDDHQVLTDAEHAENCVPAEYFSTAPPVDVPLVDGRGSSGSIVC